MDQDENLSAAELRRQAEERLQTKATAPHAPRTEDEARRLVHELEVHQIELEMQNAELRQARDEVDMSLDRYTDLYDFAPVGYLTLDRDGAIHAANLTVAGLLGIERSLLLGRRFGLFVADKAHQLFSEFLGKVFANQVKESCEVPLTREGNSPLFVQIEAMALLPGQECLIAVIDITERKQAQEARAQSEQRVRHKLESILAPEGDIGDLDLADIIDAPVVQALVDDFYKLTGMPMGLLDLKGKVLVGVGWQDICTKFNRLHPETCAKCIESDILLTAGVSHGEYKVYKCKNNMWDVATPVMVGDRHFGNLFMGQFFFEDEQIDYELFRAQAKKYGFDEREYIAALEAVPRLSRKALDTGMSFFMKLAGILSKLSYSNLKLARSLAERDALMESLRESEKRFRAMFEHHKAVMLLVDPESSSIVDANAAAADFYGRSRENLRGLNIRELNQLPSEETNVLLRDVLHEQRNHFKAPHRLADGAIRWVEVYSTPVETQGKVLLFSIIHDVTDRERAEDLVQRQMEDLRLSNEELERFNNASVGRELRMIELKKEINELCVQAGRPPRYTLDFEKEQP